MLQAQWRGWKTWEGQGWSQEAPCQCPAVPGGERGRAGCRGQAERGLLHLHCLCFHFTFCWAPLVSLCPCCVFCLTPWAQPTLTRPWAFPCTSSLLHPLSWPFYFLLSVLFSMWRKSCPQNLPTLSFGGNDQPQETNSSYLLETSRLIFPSKDQNTIGYWPHRWITRNVY